MRKCPFTGKIFDESRINEYILHLLDTREAMRKKREQGRLNDRFFGWLYEEKLKLTHPDQVPHWFLENQQTIMDALTAGCRPVDTLFRYRDVFKSGDKFTEVVWVRDPQFQDLLSNTHSCPDNGVQNFMRNPKKPTGYPGWQTWIKGKLKRDKKNNGSYPFPDGLNLVGIKTGSGGGGNENWGYDAKLFLADWPGFQVEYDRIVEQRRLDAIEAAKKKYECEQTEIMRRLKGSRVVRTS